MTDKITVLRSADGRRTTKRAKINPKTGEIEMLVGRFPIWFWYQEHAVGDIEEMSALLMKLEAAPYSMIIRGELVPGVSSKSKVRRMIHPDKKNDDIRWMRTTECGRRWVLFDFDKLEVPFVLDLIGDPDGAIAYLVGLLPDEFQDVSHCWQLSSSAGLPGKDHLSAHVWFYFDRHVTDAELEAWVDQNDLPIDKLLFHPIQPHFTASPTFPDDIPDPLPRRSGFWKGLYDDVQFPEILVIDDGSRATARDGLAGTYEAVQSALEFIDNPDLDWDEWKKMGLAIFGALADDGEDLWDEFSAKSVKYDSDATSKAWAAIRRSPPQSIGAGTIYHQARQAGWVASPDIHFNPEKEAMANGAPPTQAFLDKIMEGFDEVPCAVNHTAANDAVLFARPYAEPDFIAPRDWLYGKHYIRQFVTATVAPGGLGKSSLVLVEGLAMVTGRDLLAENAAIEPRHVWYFNLEDPMEELYRRVRAIRLRYGLSLADLGNRLFINSGRDHEMTIARSSRDGVKIVAPVVDRLRAEIKSRKIDVLIVDPFIRSHGVSENSNDEISQVVDVWVGIADECNVSIELVHHTRKLNGQEATAEDSRGGKAFVDATRGTRSLNRVEQQTARQRGLPGDPRQYFYSGAGDKTNLAPPATGDRWYRLTGVDLKNSMEDRPSDWVGVVEAYKLPDPIKEVDFERVVEVQKALADGDRRWRENVQAANWIGKLIAEKMEWDIDDDRARIHTTIKAWARVGWLKEMRKMDGDHRHERPGFEAGKCPDFEAGE